MLFKKMMVIIGGLMMAAVGMAQNTGTLQGKVFDENQEGLPFANLVLMQNGVDIQIAGTQADFDGNYSFSNIPEGVYNLEASFVGYATVLKTAIIIKPNQVTVLDIAFVEDFVSLECVVVECYIRAECNARGIGYMSGQNVMKTGKRQHRQIRRKTSKAANGTKMMIAKNANEKKIKNTTAPPGEKPSSEESSPFVENDYQIAKDAPFSTFSIDVDRASYSNIRKHIKDGQKPPKDAIRIEEMVNYFDYDYPQPKEEHPFGIYTEMSDCPWNKKAKLVQIAMQGKDLNLESAVATNLVFLIDVSGSMSGENRLSLVKESLQLLIHNMRAQDKMAMVVYAGAAGVVQASTSDKTLLLNALNQLEAGGSTAGGAGIELAYKIAKENFIENGNNRVIMATDGDFNVGISSNAGLEKLIVEKRKDNIFLTVLGFGMGNYRDMKMEILADKGNGNYAYIDNIKEAEKTLVKEMGSTLYAIAKDVKIQIVFNPTLVESYRLVGYENRILNKKDFNNDKKDAGELGAGHTVTALYEVVFADAEKPSTKSAQSKKNPEVLALAADQMMSVKLRYKAPKENKSVLVEYPFKKELLELENSSDNFRFSAAVAGFGMLLRDSRFTMNWTCQSVLELAEGAIGEDENGYREEFIGLVESVGEMSSSSQK